MARVWRAKLWLWLWQPYLQQCWRGAAEDKAQLFWISCRLTPLSLTAVLLVILFFC